MKKIYYFKSRIKFTLILLVSLLFTMNHVDAQESEEVKYNKNAIHVNVGTVVFATQASIAYERNVYYNPKYNLRVNVKAMYGNYLSNEYDDYETDAEVYNNYKGLSGVLISRIFELNLGLAYMNFNLEKGSDPDPDIDYTKKRNGIRRYGSFGVRHEKEGFILRAGIGEPELLYVGIGFSF